MATNVGNRITVEVIKLIMPIVANEIETQCLNGINWALVSNRRSAVQREYQQVREQLTQLGFHANEAMRVFSAPNGLVFDIDPIVMKKLVVYMTQGSSGAEICRNKIEIAYEQRKTAEMFRLAERVAEKVRESDTKKANFLVSLFNKSPSFETRFKGKGDDGVMRQYLLEAFALRHWDLQECNRDYIIPRGYIIKGIEIMEILPSEKGISFRIKAEAI